MTLIPAPCAAELVPARARLDWIPVMVSRWVKGEDFPQYTFVVIGDVLEKGVIVTEKETGDFALVIDGEVMVPNHKVYPMQEFPTMVDVKGRSVGFPQVAKVNDPNRIRFVIIGTAYGTLRNIHGENKAWFTELGARAELMRYLTE